MSNVTGSDAPTTGRTEMGHPHTPELIMHWMDICTDPEAHRETRLSTAVRNPLTHRDQLVAVWIEQGATLPLT